MSDKPTPLDPGKGYAWRNPGEIILPGDEVLFWGSDDKGPSWHPASNTVGKTPADVGMFVRTPVQVKDKPAKKQAAKKAAKKQAAKKAAKSATTATDDLIPDVQ